MSYDIDAIRGKISLIELMISDGHVLKRKGARWFLLCPFHVEQSPSCSVTEHGLYKCFGCGAGGDLLTYWQATRGVEFLEAARQLGQLAGTGELPDGYALPKREIVEKLAEVPPPPLAGRHLEQWLEGVDYLRKSEEDQAKLAEWRGYARDTIEVLIRIGAIGLPLYFQARQWAFPVEALDTEGKRYLCGWHVRIAESGKKKMWHYVPGSGPDRPSIGAWPFVLGNPECAACVIFQEGEWDACAQADATAWGLTERSDAVALFGIRGGRNLEHTLRYQWPKEAVAMLWRDNDETGESMLAPGGLASVLRARSRSLVTYAAEGPGVKDFNDMHRCLGPKRDMWSEFYRKMFSRALKTRKPKTITIP